MRGRGWLLLAIGWLPAPAVAQQVTLEVRECEPHAGSDRLLRARVRIEVRGERAVSRRDIRCGAHRPGDPEPLFSNPIGGSLPLRPGTVTVLDTVFPGDASHTECRCEVHARVASLVRPGPRPPPPAARPLPRRRADASMRREQVLVPVEVREAPAVSAAAVGTLPGGVAIEVDAVSAGWKRVRGGGLRGWIPADASVTDLRVLEPARRALGRVGSQNACSAVTLSELDAVVFALRPEERSVYVSHLWQALHPREKAALARHLESCFGVVRGILVSTGAEIGTPAWQGEPPRRAVPDARVGP